MSDVNSERQVKDWGSYKLYSLVNKNGVQIDISDLGAIIANFYVNDKKGNKKNIVLGYNTPNEYLNGKVYLGSVVGPWANRIAQGEFILDGEVVKLEQNEGENHLHGASADIGSKCWSVESVSDQTITLSVRTEKGEAGYPAAIAFAVTYSLNDSNELAIEYTAEPNGRTPINMTQHTYFNLNGGERDVLEHQVQINANTYLQVDEKAIPVAKSSVEHMPLDLRKPTYVGDSIDDPYIQLAYAGGFDHCWCLEGTGMKEAASVFDESTGISLSVETDQSGIQFYSGNFLSDEPGRDGTIYSKRYGLCLETQCYPDQVNMPNAEQCIYGKGEKYIHRTSFKVTTNP